MRPEPPAASQRRRVGSGRIGCNHRRPGGLGTGQPAAILHEKCPGVPCRPELAAPTFLLWRASSLPILRGMRVSEQRQKTGPKAGSCLGFAQDVYAEWGYLEREEILWAVHFGRHSSSAARGHFSCWSCCISSAGNKRHASQQPPRRVRRGQAARRGLLGWSACADRPDGM